jgi:hypothetical protein
MPASEANNVGFSVTDSQEKYTFAMQRLNKLAYFEMTDMAGISNFSKLLLGQCKTKPHLASLEPRARTIKNAIAQHQRDVNKLNQVAHEIDKLEWKNRDKRGSEVWAEYMKNFEIEDRFKTEDMIASNQLCLMEDMEALLEDVAAAEKKETRKHAALVKARERKEIIR